VQASWGIGVVIKGDEYVTNALESDASPRVQKCLDRAEYCERAASILTSPNAVATFLKAARSWREMAEQYRLMGTVRQTLGRHPPSRRGFSEIAAALNSWNRP
jgi:hypothetical protein